MDTTFGAGGRPIQWQPAIDTLYRAREMLDVRVGDPALVGPVIDVALALGITEISAPQFWASEVRGAYASALREATERAREQAEIMASAGGGRLGRVLSLSTQPDYSTFSRVGEIVTTGTTATSGSTEVTAPTITVAVSVFGRWQFVGR
jgi:uncharacterized protein YggE